MEDIDHEQPATVTWIADGDLPKTKTDPVVGVVSDPPQWVGRSEKDFPTLREARAFAQTLTESEQTTVQFHSGPHTIDFADLPPGL